MRTGWTDAARPRVLADAARSAASLLFVGAVEVIRRAVETGPMAFVARSERGMVTVSLGVASLPPRAPRKSELLRAADTAMHRANGAARNRVIAAA